MIKRTFWFILLCGLSMYLFSCQKDTSDEVYTFLSIEINPKIDFILNQEDVVTHVNFRNEDAKIAFSNEAWIGKDLDTLLETIIDEAVNTGFINLTTTSNVILIHADKIGSDAEDVQDNITAKIERYLKKQAIGAVCLSQADYLDEIKTIEDTYDVDASKAKLMYAVHEMLETQSYEKLKKMSKHKLIDQLKPSYEAAFETFLGEAASFIEIKNTFESYFLSSVQAYRIQTLKKEQVQPDLTDVKTTITSDFESEMSKISERNELTKAFVTAKDTQTIKMIMVGQYVFLSSDYDLTYFVNYHSIVLYDDGTYYERYSWTSKVTSMSASSDMYGTWSYADHKVILTFNNFDTFYDALPGRIILNQPNGNRLIFTKVSDSN